MFWRKAKPRSNGPYIVHGQKVAFFNIFDHEKRTAMFSASLHLRRQRVSRFSKRLFDIPYRAYHRLEFSRFKREL